MQSELDAATMTLLQENGPNPMFATPENLDHLPVWQNYLYGQLAHASLGLISPRIVRIGLRHDSLSVTLHFHVDPPVVADYPEIAEIAEDFDDATGNLLTLAVEIKEWEPGADTRGPLWTYQRWIGEELLYPDLQ